MTVYSQISKNKIRTFLIFAVFITLVLGFFYMIGKYFDDPGTYFIIGFLFSLFTTTGSYFYSDKIVLMTVGAKPASKKEYFDFYTVTENLAIAAGIPVPKLYVIPDNSLNAFATGRNPKHAVVCATTGLLEKLSRSELEGVIAHELSHVKNYDILLSSVVAVLVGTVGLIADWVMRMLWWRGDDDSDNRNPLFFILFIVVLILAPIAATLIQLAISRKREFLADASGALLSRNPDSLANALIKIADTNIPLQKASTSVAHLFISNPFKAKRRSVSWITSLFSTHPPIEERVKILREM